MRRAVNSLAFWGVACAIAAAAAAPAAADEEGGFWGWVPSFAVTGGVLMQHQRASVQSSCERGGYALPVTDPDAGLSSNCLFHNSRVPAGFVTAPLRPAVTDSQWAVSPDVGLDVQLMAPAIPRIPGRPRLFAWGEIDFAFGSRRNVANEGDPTGISLPPNKTYAQTLTSALAGVGSRTVSEVQQRVWGAGGGIAFPFQFRGHQLWVKPAAAWTRYGIDVEGIVLAGLKNQPAHPPANQYGNYLRSIALLQRRSETYDAVGPRLEIEMDVGKFGPIGASIFVGGGVYKVLGEREIRMSESANFPRYTPSFLEDPTLPEPLRLPADNYNATWTHEINPLLYRSWVGLRLSWLGN